MNEGDQISLSDLAKLGSSKGRDLDRIFARLSPSQQKSFLDEILPMLRISGGLEQTGNDFAKATGYGGRLGMEIPVGKDNVGFGVAGSGSKVKTPYGTFSQSDLTGGDVYYNTGPHQLSASYQKRGATPAGEPMRNLVNLLYKYKF
jgi:hypothetical protein